MASWKVEWLVARLQNVRSVNVSEEYEAEMR
jgi:hypothetical protein